MVALTKLDTIDGELAEALIAELRTVTDAPVLAVSGLTGEGVDPVLDILVERIGKVAKAIEPEEAGWSPL